MIVMNVLSTVAACVGIIILSLSLEFTFLWSRPMFCNDLDAEHFQQCYESEVIPKVSIWSNTGEWALHPLGGRRNKWILTPTQALEQRSSTQAAPDAAWQTCSVWANVLEGMAGPLMRPTEGVTTGSWIGDGDGSLPLFLIPLSGLDRRGSLEETFPGG